MNYVNWWLVDAGARVRGKTKPGKEKIEPTAKELKFTLERVKLLEQVNLLDIVADLLNSFLARFQVILWAMASDKDLW